MSPKVKSKTMEELVRRKATDYRKKQIQITLNYAILPNAPPSGFAHKMGMKFHTCKILQPNDKTSR